VIRVLLVDDEPDLLTLLSVRLDLEGDIRVVGTASSGLEALELAHLLEPDLVVMDLLMPGTDGFEAIRRLRTDVPGLAIVAYSGVVTEMARRQVEGQGVPLVHKQGDSSPLIQTIRTTAALWSEG